MSALGGGMNFYGELPESYTLKFNCKNPLSKRVMKEMEEGTKESLENIEKRVEESRNALEKIEKENKDKKEDEVSTEDKKAKEELNKTLSQLQKERKETMEKYGEKSALIHQLCDLALLSNNLLKGKELSDFIARSYDLIEISQ